MKLPKATPAAEYMKAVVQEVLSMFQSGAGVHDGHPLPMTFELAVKTLWHEIDKVFYKEWPKDAERRVSLRLQGLGEMEHLLATLNLFGNWALRASTRQVGEGGGRTVVHATGVFRNTGIAPSATLGALLAELRDDHWTVSDITLGAAC